MDNENSPQSVEGSKKRKYVSPINAFQDLVQEHLESLEQEIKDLEKRRDTLLDVTKVIDVSVIPDPITLNIGGFKHQTTKATLTKIPNSFFDLMLSGEINIKPMTNEPNTYFIDRDGTHFNYILNYLRDEGDIKIPEDIRHCVRKEMEFYRINDHFKLDDTVTILDQLNSLKEKLDEEREQSNKTKKEIKLLILSDSSSILNCRTFKIISDWIDITKTLTFELLYASEGNKFRAPAFHSACDGKGPTVTVIETTDGYVFGGYNSQSWKNTGGFRVYGDDKCFIFTLVNKHGIPPTKYLPIKNIKEYVASNTNGPIFGNFDIAVKEAQGSYQLFPLSYKDTTGKGDKTLTPSRDFSIKNIEIYKCS